MLRRISSTSQTQIGWNSQGAGRARNGTVLDDKRRTRATTTATETARDGQDDTHGSRADYIFSVRRFGFVPMNYIVLRSWWWSDRRSVCDRREERLAVALKWWFTIHWVCTRLGTRKASSSSSWSTLFGVVPPFTPRVITCTLSCQNDDDDLTIDFRPCSVWLCVCAVSLTLVCIRVLLNKRRVCFVSRRVNNAFSDEGWVGSGLFSSSRLVGWWWWMCWTAQNKWRAQNSSRTHTDTIQQQTNAHSDAKTTPKRDRKLFSFRFMTLFVYFDTGQTQRKSNKMNAFNSWICTNGKSTPKCKF